jgi:hypothetical protein
MRIDLAKNMPQFLGRRYRGGASCQAGQTRCTFGCQVGAIDGGMKPNHEPAEIKRRLDMHVTSKDRPVPGTEGMTDFNNN